MMSTDTENTIETSPLSRQFDLVPDCWKPVVSGFAATSTGCALIRHIDHVRRPQTNIYPDNIFTALHLTAIQDVKVCILGQDPYHGAGQAHGLAFSVQRGVAIPPSLRNIRKEIQRDLGLIAPEHGCLEDWAKRGVLLLNTSLTVEEGEPGSHAKLGWEQLTDNIIAAVAKTTSPKVFMLWGAHAQKKRALIEAASSARPGHNMILESNHPSPLSAMRPPAPFLGNGHFSAANQFLQSHGIQMDWSLN